MGARRRSAYSGVMSSIQFEERTMGSAYAEDDFESDFALGGEVEFDETDEADAGLEMELLVARVQAARDAGA
jgi:hypothetical protein